MKSLCIVGICSVLVACGGDEAVGLKLQGQLVSSALAQSSPVLLGIAWYPAFAAATPGAPVGGVVTQRGVTYEGNFPLDFTFEVEGAPPAEALFDLSTIGGEGHLGYGVLVAYDDRNENGELDLIPSGGAPIDQIVGLSVPDPSLPPPEESFYVVYVDGEIPADNYFGANELVQGYNIERIHYNYGIDAIPLDSRVTLPITSSDALDIYACREAFASPDTLLAPACGIDPFGGKYRAEGALYSYAGARTFLQLFVSDVNGVVADASVAVDGEVIPWDDAGQQFSYQWDTAFTGSHVITISVPGHDVETLPFTLPEQVAILAPTEGQQLQAGQPQILSWTSAAGTAYYDPYFLTDDEKSSWLYHTITTETSVTTGPIDYVGPASLSLRAIAPLAVGSQGSYLTPISYAAVSVDFVQ